MEEFEPLVQRQKNKKEGEPIDTDEQEKFISEISDEYLKSVKNNRFLIYLCCGIFCLIHSIFLYLSDDKICFALKAISFIFPIIAELTRKNLVWLGSIAFELASVFYDIVYPPQLDTKMNIVLHVVYFLLLYHKIASKKFEDKFPDEIKNLEEKKYQYKIA